MTNDPIEFANQFYGQHILSPCLARCGSKDCSNSDLLQENIATKYSPFLLIGAGMFTAPGSSKILYTNFPYEMKFDDAHYILHSKVYSMTDPGLHFYMVATVEHQNECFLARLDNLKPKAEVLMNRISRISQEILCQPDKTTITCYKLLTVNKI